MALLFVLGVNPTESVLQLYHSIHAKGERVEDVIRAAEEAEAQSHGNGSNSPIASTEVRDANEDDLEDGELQDESISQTTHAAVNNMVLQDFDLGFDLI